MTLTYLRRLAVADVRDFGARGDGSTDDTAAFQAAVNSGRNVFIPKASGQYRIVGQVSVPAGTTVYSDGAEILVDPAGEYLGAMRAAGNEVCFDGLKFVGNNVSTEGASQSSNTRLGAAIRGFGVKYIAVKNCSFKNFVMPVNSLVGNCIIGFNQCSDISVVDNWFFASNVGANDISVDYRVGNTIVSRNHSESDSDIFCAISSIGSSDLIANTEISITSHHVITDNVIIKKAGQPTPTGRHGIMLHYNGGITHAIVKGNIIVNTARHGVYIRGANTVGAATGPSIVANNILRYCGGYASAGNQIYSAQSGIKVESTEGLIVTGNLIEKCGYDTDGTTRLGTTAGIEMAKAVRHCTVSDNHIQHINGAGIVIQPTASAGLEVGDTSIENLSIRGNQVRNVTQGGIIVLTRVSDPGTVPTRGVTIESNTVQISASNMSAILISTVRNSANCVETMVARNVLICTGAGSNRVGVCFEMNTTQEPQYTISDNIIRGFEFGIRVAPALTGTPGSYTTSFSGAVPHRLLGTLVTVDRNHFVSCGKVLKYLDSGDDLLTFIGPRNKYTSTALPDASMIGADKVCIGEVNGFDGSGNRLVTIYSTSVPTAGQYYRGDRVINTQPAVDEPDVWVCTVSGTPGTWVARNVVNPV